MHVVLARAGIDLSYWCNMDSRFRGNDERSEEFANDERGAGMTENTLPLLQVVS
jgi:hypothetical protein